MAPDVLAERSLAVSAARLGLVSRRRMLLARWRAGDESLEHQLLRSGGVAPGELLAAARERWAVANAPASVRYFDFPISAPQPVGGGALARSLDVSATAVATAAAVVAIDLGVTALWQEPLSAVAASHSQSELRQGLDALERRWPAVAPDPDPAPRAERDALAAAELRRRTGLGDPLGRIEIPAIETAQVIVEGAGDVSLRKGPGHFAETALPGEGTTVAIAGHRTTYLAPFRRLDELDAGDRIVASMPYGRFDYEVTKSMVVEPDEYWVAGPTRSERLVLTTCHPLFSDEQRFVVFARPVDS